jgi:hypothetical protein
MNGALGYIFEMYYRVVQICEDYFYSVNIGRIKVGCKEELKDDSTECDPEPCLYKQIIHANLHCCAWYF